MGCFQDRNLRYASQFGSALLRTIQSRVAYNALVGRLDGSTILNFAGSLLSFGAGILALIPFLKKTFSKAEVWQTFIWHA